MYIIWIYVLQYAHLFYIAQWYRDCTVEADNVSKISNKRKSEEDEENNAEAMQNAEQKKAFLLAQFESINKNASYRYSMWNTIMYCTCMIRMFICKIELNFVKYIHKQNLKFIKI